MSYYCSISDVYTWVPRGTIQAQARTLGSVSTGTEIVTVDGHGLITDDPVTLRSEAGGSMPSPLVAGTTYYVIRLTDSTFQLAASAGGVAINLTTAGENVVLVVQAPWDRWVWQASAEVDCMLRAHVVPLQLPYPEVVKTYTAGLVAERALTWSCQGLPPGFDERIKRAKANLDSWQKGYNVRGTNAPTASNVAVLGSSTGSDPLGWGSRGYGVLP